MTAPREPQVSSLADVRALTPLLAAAFDDDPILNFFVRQDRRRREALRELFDVVLRRMTLSHGLCTHTDHAVALVVPGDRWSLDVWTQFTIAPSIVRAGGWWRIGPVIRAFDALERAHPADPHLYLTFLAVHPDQQGRGFGTTLLRSYLKRADREGIGVYLENTKAENLAFYQRHGFEVTGMIRLDDPNLQYWSMWRAPRR